MKYRLMSAAVLLALALPAWAQDIPLSQILVENEGWREVIKDNAPLTLARDNSQATTNLGTYGWTGKHVNFYSKSKQDCFLWRFVPELTSPSCFTVWPDGGHLVIGEANGAYLWAARIEKDGSLGPGDRYYSLRTVPGQKMQVTAMTMDAKYLLYACTPLGIQVFDPTGRLSGVIASPSKEPITAIVIGGPNANDLFVAAGDKIYARRIQGKAAYTLKK